MKSSLRRKELLNYLEKNHIGYTSALCQELKVSAMTIHRDFEAMAKQGLVTLIRGGAAINHGSAVLYSQGLRQTQLPLEKRRIAAYCVGLVHEGTTVYLDCGSTAERIAEALRTKKGITVLTNSLDSAHVLSGSKENKLVMVPGIFFAPLRGFSGQMTTEFMSRFNVDILFLGANGLSVGSGLTSPDFTDADTKRVLVKLAQKVVVATDHTKLGKDCFITIAKLSEIDLIVTDNEADTHIIEDMREHGANIKLV